MRALNRKLVRDLGRMWTQVLAIASVIAAGVAVCITMLSALESLEVSRDDYYADTRFADVFASAKRAPENVANRLRELPDVVTVETRVVADVTLDVPGLAEPAVGRMISLPDQGEPALNRLTLRAGRLPELGRDEVAASEAFVNANDLEVGSSIAAVMNGRWRRLTIVGIALSPEYVYSIREGDLFPDDRRFGVFWMRRHPLAAAFDLDGAFNDVSFQLTRNARVDDVIAAVDVVLDDYGAIGSYARKDQTSAWFLENEFKELSNMGFVTPFIFAGVAAFLLNVVISRLVTTQRLQIGVLKAFGYPTRAFTVHYVVFVLVIVAIGTALGTAIGAWTGRAWTEMYADFFRFPSLEYVLPRDVVLIAAVVAAIVAVSATLGAVWRSTAVPPAEAMRPQGPASYRRGILDRLRLQHVVPLSTRMIVRNIERRPLRTLLSVCAIALAVAIVIVATFTVDSIHHITDVQFNAAERQDVTVTFIEPRARRALYELNRLPGVLLVEPSRMVAVRVRAAHHWRRVAIVGLTSGATLTRVVDEDLRPVDLPADGVVLNDALADVLDVRAGDELIVEILEGARATHTVVVAAVIPQYLGLTAYMDLTALNRLMREGSLVSGAYLSVDPRESEPLYAALKEMPGVAGVTVTKAARLSFEETIAAVVNTVTAMFLLFGASIAFSVIYNDSRIAFAERSRELGTLHVLGYSHREMAVVLLGETALLTCVAAPVGILAGRALAALVVVLFDTEIARIPLVITPTTNLVAVGVTFASAALSAAATWHQLVRLDVLGVLKAPE